jgi:hypothetical protein
VHIACTTRRFAVLAVERVARARKMHKLAIIALKAVNDLTKLVITGTFGALGGYFVGISTHRFKNRFDVLQLRKALYSEIVQNYRRLHDYAQRGVVMGEEVVKQQIQQRGWITVAYAEACSKASLFIQLRDHDAIDRLYSILTDVEAGSSLEELKGAHAEFEGVLYSGHLKKQTLLIFLDNYQVRRIPNYWFGYSCHGPFRA